MEIEVLTPVWAASVPTVGGRVVVAQHAEKTESTFLETPVPVPEREPVPVCGYWEENLILTHAFNGCPAQSFGSPLFFQSSLQDVSRGKP